MLLRDFYTINDIKQNDEISTVQVQLNPNHKVYEGHFPVEPVTPGVCTLQIIKECAGQILNGGYHYTQISSCKFLSVINPKLNNVLELQLKLSVTDEGIAVLADVFQKEQQVLKLKANLQKA